MEKEFEKKAYSELMQQSVEETTFYMTSAMDIISNKYGVAYAEDHPELVAAFMQTAAIINLESVLMNKLENIEKAIDQIQ
ncbi:hypothetical protein AAE250_16140 [Bacteroides sp. GD17]|jgi:hypothetical protein|uniref:hypothetical protein n=1 Tax=Bacteroides sp. GD17 TaxID=3139826 RepID=UPI00205B8830|nr:hypothetical protein [uncultured Bacteroides sp.]DAV67245.1 MAG TPA: hypothetical protein [Caudoviricetes sp.]